MDQSSVGEIQNQPSVDTIPSSQSSVAQTATVQPEKTLTQTEVNHLIGRVKAEERERYQRTASENISPVNGLTAEEVRRISAEEAQKKHDEFEQKRQQQYLNEQGVKTINELKDKFEGARSKYPDFEEKVTPYINQTNGGALGLSNLFDNSADIVYEFANRPSVLYEINAAFATGGQQAAYQAIAKLSQSIKLNEAATSIKTPNEPLSQIKSSPVKSDDGSMSIKDRMRQLSRSK